MIAALGIQRILNWRLRLFEKNMLLLKYLEDDFKSSGRCNYNANSNFN